MTAAAVYTSKGVWKIRLELSTKGALIRIHKGNYMLILGVDPGTTTSGAAIYNTGMRRANWSDKAVDNQHLVEWLIGGGTGVQVIVLETLKPQGQILGTSTFETIFWVGRFYQAALQAGEAGVVTCIPRPEVRRRLLGKANAPKADAAIRQVLIDQIGPQGKKADPGPTYGVASHAWQALALAYAHLHPEGI